MLQTFFLWIGYTIIMFLIVSMSLLYILYLFEQYKCSKLKKFLCIINIRRKIKIRKSIYLIDNSKYIRFYLIGNSKYIRFYHKKNYPLDKFQKLVLDYLKLKGYDNVTYEKVFPFLENYTIIVVFYPPLNKCYLLSRKSNLKMVNDNLLNRFKIFIGLYD